MSIIYFTADSHIGHPRVAELRGFGSVEEHDAWYAEMWRSKIRSRDQVYILGDIAVHHPQKALDLLVTLPGTKHLVAGNHDPVHPMFVSGYNRWYRKFADVFATISQTRTVKVNGEPVTLSHFPFAAWGDGEGRPGSRYDEWRVPDTGRPLLHGHTHGRERAHGNSLHVGIDAWGQPVPESWVAEWLAREERRPLEPWLGGGFATPPGSLPCQTTVCYPGPDRTLANHRAQGRFFRCSHDLEGL